jgi:hypothetical protein
VLISASLTGPPAGWLCARQGIVHPNSPLENTDYGTREFGMIDNHGVLITFFETTPGAA